jgi:hypothetical protein
MGEFALDLVHIERRPLSAIERGNGLLNVVAQGLVPLSEFSQHSNRRHKDLVLRLVLAAGDCVIYELP